MKASIYNQNSSIIEIKPGRAQYLIARSNSSDESNIIFSSLNTIAYNSLKTSNNDNWRSFQHKTCFEYIPGDSMALINTERTLFRLKSLSGKRRNALYGLKDKRFLFQQIGMTQFFTITNTDDYNYASKTLIEM